MNRKGIMIAIVENEFFFELYVAQGACRDLLERSDERNMGRLVASEDDLFYSQIAHRCAWFGLDDNGEVDCGICAPTKVPAHATAIHGIGRISQRMTGSPLYIGRIEIEWIRKNGKAA